MPWKIRKRGERYDVVKPSSGKVFGRHRSKAKASRQIRALYASEKKRSS